MFLNMDQLEKQLDKEEFQEIGSMAGFKVLETQFQTFIKSQIYLDDEYVIMTRKYFLEYTQLKIREFRNTLIQHMESVKKSIDKRALLKREYDSRVDEKQIQTTEGKVDSCKALDASLVDTTSSRTELGEQIHTADQGMDATRPMMQISNPYMMKSQWLRHYKELSDSIKTMRAKTIEHTTSLIAKNDEFKAQLQEKGFAMQHRKKSSENRQE
ncbi:hypothetical protein Tco_0631051 [Tanacetum coccineum]